MSARDNFKTNHQQIKALLLFLVSLWLIAGMQACSILNLKAGLSESLRFRIAGVKDFSLNGIAVTNKQTLQQFTLNEGLSLAHGFARGQLPASFKLLVGVQNPNGSEAGTKEVSALITELLWTLYVDDVEAASGRLAEPKLIPAVADEQIVELKVDFDWAKTFKAMGYEKALKLALGLADKNADLSPLKLKAQPQIHTDYGTLNFPEPFILQAEKTQK